MMPHSAFEDHGIKPGMIVQSRAGHDKGRHYLVMDSSEKNVWLVDGRYRSCDRPKKKNVRHVMLVQSLEHFDAIMVQSAELMNTLDNMGDTGQKNAAVREYVKQVEKLLEKNGKRENKKKQ
jgi:ribosomal protein L14E/L6E/L27E